HYIFISMEKNLGYLFCWILSGQLLMKISSVTMLFSFALKKQVSWSPRVSLTRMKDLQPQWLLMQSEQIAVQSVRPLGNPRLKEGTFLTYMLLLSAIFLSRSILFQFAEQIFKIIDTVHRVNLTRETKNSFGKPGKTLTDVALIYTVKLIKAGTN
ncbi:hypothetical protein ACJX0J_021490, partial [Zea mays]